MSARAVRKKEVSKDVTEVVIDELRRALHETSLLSALPDGFNLAGGLDFRTAVAEYERSLIEEALRISSGQKKKAARLLNMSPSTLHGKIKALGINPDRFVR
jgi:DNA-binding NtrC family response regulator